MNIIFDIDGTIWNTTGVIADAWQAAADRSGLTKARITAEQLSHEFGKTMDVIAKNVFPDVKEQKDLDMLIDLCCKYEEDALDKMDQGTTDSIVYDGIIDTIKTLSKKHRLFIVSNCQKGYVELNTRKCNTGDHIEDHLCYGDTGMRKGDTIKQLMKKHKLKKADTVYVGDTAGDFEESRYAGIRFIFASYGFGTVKDPDAVIRKPRGLIRAIANLQNR